jgi:hypothetical protein
MGIKKHSKELKAIIALDAIKGQKTRSPSWGPLYYLSLITKTVG